MKASRRGDGLATPTQNDAAEHPLPREPLSKQLEDPCFYLVDFDFAARMMVFCRGRPEWFAERLRISAFDLPIQSLIWVPFDAVLARPSLGPDEPSINYCFHLPFCGSSFLTRHLEHESVLLLRDPASLDAVFRRTAGSPYPPDITRLREVTLALLNRRLGARATVVRTAGYYPKMVSHLVESPTFRSAVFIYSSPEHYLAQILKSHERRRHARLLMTSRQSFVRERTGERLATLTDAAVAALFWLSAVENIVRIADDDGQRRLRTLDCEVLLAQVETTIPRVCALFGIEGLSLGEAQVRALGATHAKTGQSFTLSQREQELTRVGAAHDDEIKAGVELLRAANSDALMAALAARHLG